METDQGTVYLLSTPAEEKAEWARPVPVEEVVAQRVAATTDLARADLSALESYVDPGTVRAVLENGERDAVTFDVEGHEVQITNEGEVAVQAD